MRRRLTSRGGSRGFTLIELVVVLAISAVLLTIAIGGFGGMFARKRMEGLAADFVTDLQQARAEAVARNVPVQVTFGTNCHVLHTNAATVTCNGASAVPSSSTATIRVVERPSNGTSFTVQATGGAAPTFIRFDNRNGAATTNNNAVDPGVLVGSSAGSWQLRVRVNPMGRVDLCSPSSSLRGYPEC